MKESFQNHRKNRTKITDTNTLEKIWLEIKNDYRTLLELTEVEDQQLLDKSKPGKNAEDGNV